MVHLIGLTRTAYGMCPHKQRFLPDVTILMDMMQVTMKLFFLVLSVFSVTVLIHARDIDPPSLFVFQSWRPIFIRKQQILYWTVIALLIL